MLSSTEKDPSTVDSLQSLLLSHDTKQITYTSFLLTHDGLELLKNMLQHNEDIFAWTHSDMLGIHLVVASHKLNVSPTSQPVRKKIRHFHLDRQNHPNGN